METKRLLEAWDATDSVTREAGRVWYPDAHDFSQRLADDAGLSVECVAGIVAAMSPQISWQRNKDLAEAFVAGQEVRGIYRANLRKATAIVVAGTAEGILNPKTAPKCWNFWHNIANPQDRAYVTIDRHAYSVYIGVKVSDPKWNGTGPKMPPLTKANRYQDCAQAYTAAAKRVGVLPCEFQATLWIAQPKGRVSK